MTTRIFENPAVHGMRGLVLSMLDRIKWRHHGIGALQGYVSEHGEPEVRVHIWSRRLVKPGIDVSGDIHDHRFDMISHVLCGFVDHEVIVPEMNPNGDHTMMALTHARAAADTYYHGPTTPLEGRCWVTRKLYRIGQGMSYSFAAQNFHRSPVADSPDHLAVTCVEKHQQRETPARLLYPVAHDPVMAFGHVPDQKIIDDVVALAKKRLAGD